LVGKPEEKRLLERLKLDDRLILIWTLKQGGKELTEFISHMTNGKLL
jgi:hypothetical protein